MNIPENVLFPGEIDPRLYLSDMKKSSAYIKSEIENSFGKSTTENFVKRTLDKTDEFYFGSEILNYLDKKICSAGEYIKEMEKLRPFITSEYEPTDVFAGDAWISKVETIDTYLYKTGIDDLHAGEDVGLIN